MDPQFGWRQCQVRVRTNDPAGDGRESAPCLVPPCRSTPAVVALDVGVTLADAAAALADFGGVGAGFGSGRSAA
jgi:hypothetical protein